MLSILVTLLRSYPYASTLALILVSGHFSAQGGEAISSIQASDCVPLDYMFGDVMQPATVCMHLTYA